MKKKLNLSIRIFISLSLVGYFIITLSSKYGGFGKALGKIFANFSDAAPGLILLAVILTFTGLSLMSLRWKILLKPHGADPEYKKLFTYYLMAAFFNNFLPSSIGGDALRAVESRKLTRNTATSVTVIIIERLTGLFALLIITFAAFLIKNHKNIFSGLGSNTVIFLAALMGIFFFLVILTLPRVAAILLRLLKKLLPLKVFRFINESYNAVRIYYEYPLELFKAQLVSIVFQFQMVFYYYFLVKSINQEVEFLDCMLKVPVIIFFLMTVPSINGLGVRTSGFNHLSHFTAAQALAVEILDLGLRLCFGLAGGVLFLLHRKSEPSMRDLQEGEKESPDSGVLKKDSGTR